MTFDPPGHIDELPAAARAAWSAQLADHASQFAFTFPRYLDPDAPAAPADFTPVSIAWSASPARLQRTMTDQQRWQLADETRDEQDEYCEWRVARDVDGVLTAVTFTTEVPEYWSHVAESDPGLLLSLHAELLGHGIDLSEVTDATGRYLPDNQWNNAQSAGLTHLRQPTNTLLAAIRLAAESTIQRVRADGTPVIGQQELVACGQLGDPHRNSDPQIAGIVNNAVFAGSGVTLANPLGLYLDGLQSAGFSTPDGADAADFWTPERGASTHVVRARLEVPAGRGYRLGDLTLDGQALRFGAQVADKVRVRLDALTAPSSAPLASKPCV